MCQILLETNPYITKVKIKDLQKHEIRYINKKKIL